MGINKLQDWLDGKYVSPQEFKSSLEKVIKYMELYENAVKDDDETKSRYAFEIGELISLNLWSARRLKHQQYKDFAYDELESITGQKHERV